MILLRLVKIVYDEHLPTTSKHTIGYHARYHFNWACIYLLMQWCNNHNCGCLGMQDYCTTMLTKNAEQSKKKWNKSALAGWQSKQARSAMWYALHTMATSFNNHPYISIYVASSAMPVGMVVEKINVHLVMVWSVYSVCAWHFLFVYFFSQCIHWAIPIMQL